MKDTEGPSVGLEQEIAAHSSAYDIGDMSLSEYINGGLALAARRFDQRRHALGINPGLFESLEKVLREQTFQAAFNHGYYVRKPRDIDRRNDTVKSATSLIEGVFGENVTDMYFADAQLSGSKLFFNDLEKAKLPEEIKGAASLLKISYGANARIRSIIEPMLTGAKSKIEEGKEDDFWSDKIAKIRIGEGYLARVRPLIRSKFAQIYGDEAVTAQYLWTLLSFSQITAGDKESRRKRIEIMRVLGSGDVAQAKDLTVRFLAENPGAVKPRYTRELKGEI